MATQVAAYRNSDASESQKERHFFSVADLEKFFETCDGSLLPHRFQRLIYGMWLAAGKPFGGEILLFSSTENYRARCRYKSDRTVRYNLRAARSERFKFLEVVSEHHRWIRPRSDNDRGCYRSVTTYRLSLDLLTKWRSVHRGEVAKERKPAQPSPVPRPDPPAAPQPVPIRPAAETPKSNGHRSNQREPNRRERQEIAAAIGKIRQLMRGVQYINGLRQPSAVPTPFPMDKDDERYRAPLSLDQAIVEVSRDGIPEPKLREWLKLCNWKFNEADS
jgi:hypothetical protein